MTRKIKKQKKNYWGTIVAGVLAILAVATYRLSTSNAGAAKESVILAPAAVAPTSLDFQSDDKPAPDFALEDLNGNMIKLSEYKGKVVVLNFWATWCPPCRVEMPWFEKLARERAADGFVVVGASMDRGNPDELRWFLEEQGITYPIGVAGPSMVRDYGGVRGLPTSFLIDRRGHIRHTVIGIFAEPTLRAAVDRLLSEK